MSAPQSGTTGRIRQLRKLDDLIGPPPSGSATKNVPLTLDERAGYFPASDADPFWITVDGGQVTRIAQQYLP
jgi:hypothetical protein